MIMAWGLAGHGRKLRGHPARLGKWSHGSRDTGANPSGAFFARDTHVREDTNAGVKTGQSTILTVTLLTGANGACWHVRHSAW